MSIPGKIARYFKDADFRLHVNTKLGFMDNVSDEDYVKKLFKVNMGYELDLDNPRTFNEKLNWLKLYDRRPEYPVLVDKYRSKEVIASRIGEEYIVPLLGVWDKAEDIDFDMLPKKFILKNNHDSGGLVICKDKDKLGIASARKTMEKGLHSDYFKYTREWPYSAVPRKIIAEELLEDQEDLEGGIKDYKFFCFDGIVKVFKIDFDRFVGHHANYYDAEGNLLPFGKVDGPPDYSRNLKMPVSLSTMIEKAEILAQGIPFVRIDFYEVEGRPYFGEFTLYPSSGCRPFTDYDWDLKMGQWVTLPRKSC